MKSPNKIRERDMDDDFLLSLKTGVDLVDARKLLLDYLRRDEVISTGQLPIDELRRLLGLDNEEDLNSMLHSLISIILKLVKDEQGKGYKVNVQRNGNSYVIKVVDDNGLAHDIIVYSDTMWDIEEVENALVDNHGENASILIEDELGNRHEILVDSDASSISSADGANEEIVHAIIDLQSHISKLETKVSKIETGGSSSGSSGDIGSLYDDIMAQVRHENNELKGKLDDYKLKIDELERKVGILEQQASSSRTITRDMLEASLADKIKYIDTLQDKMNAFETRFLERGGMKAGQVLYCIDDDGNIEGRNIITYAVTCETEEEVEMGKNNKSTPILNVSTGKIYNYREDVDTYNESDFIGGNKQDNTFVYDINTNSIKYIVANDTITELSNSSGGVSVNVKTFKIPVGQSVSVNRPNNLKKVPPTVLMKDELSESRTNGQYINSEGYVTVSNADSSFTIYNDSQYELDVLAIMVNSAKSTETVEEGDGE